MRGDNKVKKYSIFQHQTNQCDIAFLQETYSWVQDMKRWLQDGSEVSVHETKHRGVAIVFSKTLV